MHDGHLWLTVVVNCWKHPGVVQLRCVASGSNPCMSLTSGSILRLDGHQIGPDDDLEAMLQDERRNLVEMVRAEDQSVVVDGD